MCSLVMSLCSRDNTMNGSRSTGLTCSQAPGFWMVEHQFVVDNKDNCPGLYLQVAWNSVYLESLNQCVQLLSPVSLCVRPLMLVLLKSAFSCAINEL